MKLGKSQRNKDLVKVASVACFNADGMLLFGLRKDSGKWNLPGGHLEPGEAPLEGARRELKEETGLEGRNFQFLGKGQGSKDVTVYSYRCTAEGDPTGDLDPDEECDEWRWVEPDDIPAEIRDNLHNAKDITLRLLGLQEGIVEESMAKSARREWRAKDGLRVPSINDPARQPWDKAYHQKLVETFGNGDAKRLRPVKVPVTEHLSGHFVQGPVGPGGRDRRGFYKRMLAGGDKLPPIVVRRMGQGWHVVDGNARVHAALAHGLPELEAVEILDQNGLKKGLPGAMVASLLSAAPMAAQKPAQAPQVNQAAQEQGFPAWHPDGLSSDLHPIAQLESSGGLNTHHTPHSGGQYHTAFGALGFKPITAHEEYKKSKILQGSHPNLTDPAEFMKVFQADPKFYNLLASAHWERLKHRHGSPEAAAYAWRWGSGATANAKPEDIEKDSYVQKFKHMSLHQKQYGILQHQPLLNKGELHPGYTFRAHNEQWEPAEEGYQYHAQPFNITAHDQRGEEIGHAEVYHHGLPQDPGGTKMMVSNVLVEPAHRRRGVASAMYQLAEKLSGKKLHPYPEQKAPGKKLWAQPERPFGKAEDLAKMAVIHDDARRPKTVYRVENEVGEGPYHTDDEHGVDLNQGQTFDAKRDFAEHPKEHAGRKLLYGFEHPSHAATWFGDDGLSELENQGYTISAVPASKVYRSATGSQVLFEPHKSYKPGQHPSVTRWEEPIKKSEAHDPLDAMLDHDDPKERILALKHKDVTPYHLRRGLHDEDPQVREFAARHPKMTEALLGEALHHGDLSTREAALSRPDLQEHHLEQVLFDPDLQVQVARHPAITAEQKERLMNHHATPRGLSQELLHKSDKIEFPNLGTSMVKPTSVRGGSGPGGRTTYKTRKLGATATPGITSTVNLDSPFHNGNWHHEAQHGIFAQLKQKYGEKAAQKVIDHTLGALDHADHQHLNRITGWALQEGGYHPDKYPEEKLAFLQNYIHDPLWKEQAHKAMGIHGDKNAEFISEQWGDRLHQKLQARAAGVSHGQVGIHLKSEDESILEWMNLNKLETDKDYNVYEDMLGLDARSRAYAKAAEFLSHQDVNEQVFRETLVRTDDIEEAALTAVNMDASAENKTALRAVVELQDMSKTEALHQVHDIEAMMPDGTSVADGIRRGFGAHTEKHLKLGGRHSSGAMSVRDPQSQQQYLIKPGSGKQSPAKGARQDPSNQSRREAAFWHVAQMWGIGSRFPRADLMLLDGREVAALHLLPPDWKNLEKLRLKDGGLPARALEKYRQTGEIHRWAVIDYVLGNPDRHGQNLMVGPRRDDYPVALIDHGSAFAGDAFDPANDKNSFVPYYLRAWQPEDWAILTIEQRIKAMPILPHGLDDDLKYWIHRLSADDLESILHRFGIDPAPSLKRLARIKALLGVENLSTKINQLWVTT